MNKAVRKYDLEERLVAFAVIAIDISENLTDSKAANYLGGQLLRSGISPALHYGEAQGAESPRDFIHKLKVLLKELRETMNTLRIIKLKFLTTNLALAEKAIVECNELISIFVASVATAQRNSSLK